MEEDILSSIYLSFKLSIVFNGLKIWLVHPPRVVRIFSLFLGIDVPAILVKLHLPALLAHVDLKLLRRPSPLRAIVRIAHAVHLLAQPEAHPAPRRKLHVQRSAQRAAQD